MWDQPIPKEDVLRGLVESTKETGIDDPDMVLTQLLKREQESSTFFNEGVAFPHVRMDDLARPITALGITKNGISDVSTDKPIKLVFLILSPKAEPDIQLQLLRLVSRASQSRHLFQTLVESADGAEAFAATRDWERLNGNSG